MNNKILIEHISASFKKKSLSTVLSQKDHGMAIFTMLYHVYFFVLISVNNGKYVIPRIYLVLYS